MNARCVPASAEAVRAFWFGDGLIISAQGTLPATCWEARIDESPLDIWPPEFILSQCSTAAPCLEVLVPYHVSESFPLGSRPDEIGVYDADGRRTVEVKDIPTEKLASPAAEVEADEATGLSGNMSFDEAFADALQKLPPWGGGPDEMAVITVVETGAWLGGIAGFHHLFVKVRRARHRQS